MKTFIMYTTLVFGDIIDETVNDVVVSNNGDSRKVLRTVASTIKNFFAAHPTSIVLIFGNTETRVRLYRMMISSNIQFFSDQFDIFGLVDGNWYEFEVNIKYEGFMIRSKTNHKFVIMITPKLSKDFFDLRTKSPNITEGGPSPYKDLKFISDEVMEKGRKVLKTVGLPKGRK